MPLARATYLLSSRIGFVMRFRAHDVGDTEPLLALILHLDARAA